MTRKPTYQVSIRFSESENAALEKAAEKERLTVSGYVRLAVREKIEKFGKAK